MKLDEIRKEIDTVDNEMRDLFIRRMGYSRQIALEKARTGDSVYKPDREREMTQRLSADVDPSIREAYRSFLKQILLLSRTYQEQIIRECAKEAGRMD